MNDSLKKFIDKMMAQGSINQEELAKYAARTTSLSESDVRKAMQTAQDQVIGAAINPAPIGNPPFKPIFSKSDAAMAAEQRMRDNMIALRIEERVRLMTLSQDTDTLDAMQFAIDGLKRGYPQVANDPTLTATGPSRYVKRPVAIEAWKYDGTNGIAIAEWVNASDIEESGWRKSTRRLARVYDENNRIVLKIETLEGDMEISVGDYVVCGVENEFYPCKPSIFHKTHVPVSDFAQDQGLVEEFKLADKPSIPPERLAEFQKRYDESTEDQ